MKEYAVQRLPEPSQCRPRTTCTTVVAHALERGARLRRWTKTEQKRVFGQISKVEV